MSPTALLVLVAFTAATLPGCQSGNDYVTWTEMIERLKELPAIEQTNECRFCGPDGIVLNGEEFYVVCGDNDPCTKYTCEGNRIDRQSCENDDKYCVWGNWTPCTCGYDGTSVRWRNCLEDDSVKSRCSGNLLETKNCGWCNCSIGEQMGANEGGSAKNICRPICIDNTMKGKKRQHERVACQQSDQGPCTDKHTYPRCTDDIMRHFYGANWNDTTRVDNMSADENKGDAANIMEKLLRMYYNT